MPCFLIVVLSWVSFWLNREATSDRVGLGMEGGRHGVLAQQGGHQRPGRSGYEGGGLEAMHWSLVHGELAAYEGVGQDVRNDWECVWVIPVCL